MSINLNRYLKPQKKNYAIIYSDTLLKKYDSGWVDYIFPRLKEQEDSERSKGYGLEDKEIDALWNNKLLRNNYIEMLKLILNNYTPEDYNTIFSDRARYKINQSIHIFLGKQNSEILNLFINMFYPDEKEKLKHEEV